MAIAPLISPKSDREGRCALTRENCKDEAATVALPPWCARAAVQAA